MPKNDVKRPLQLVVSTLVKHRFAMNKNRDIDAGMEKRRLTYNTVFTANDVTSTWISHR